MKSVYITADFIGTPTGGGVVTFHEQRALAEVSYSCDVFSRANLEPMVHALPNELKQDPWCWDNALTNYLSNNQTDYQIAHLYSGTFSRTVELLKSRGTKVFYTAAAHSIQESKTEHELLGIPYEYQYPHLIEPGLWQQYIQGCRLADVVVCPSEYSASIMRGYGCERVSVVPHGVTLPTAAPYALPRCFTVGYLGAVGPDKGLIYLLQAWQKLNYTDSSVLKIAGSQSTSEFLRGLMRAFPGGNVELCGWINEVSDFYNNISCYVQPSASEGFGIEVLEALAHGRQVICSSGAGAKDVLEDASFIFPARDITQLADLIHHQKTHPTSPETAKRLKKNIHQYDWKNIQQRYQTLWRSL